MQWEPVGEKAFSTAYMSIVTWRWTVRCSHCLHTSPQLKKKEMKNKKLLPLKMHCSTFWVCMWLCFLFLVLPARTASSGHWFFIPSTPNCLLWRICIFSIALDLVHNAWPSVLTYKEENLVRKPSGLEPRSVQESCQGELRVLRWTWRTVHGSALLSTWHLGLTTCSSFVSVAMKKHYVQKQHGRGKGPFGLNFRVIVHS